MVSVDSDEVGDGGLGSSSMPYRPSDSENVCASDYGLPAHDRSRETGGVSWWSTVRSVGDALGVWERHAAPVGCTLGETIYRETKRSAQVANLRRSARPLEPATVRRLGPLFPGLDLTGVRVRTRCRLPANRFHPTGSIYAMTFGSTIYWRDELDERRPDDIVKLIHELVHVDQVRRFGDERRFACAYGQGYVKGGGDLPGYLATPRQYHRNPLEAEAYTFEARFRDAAGRVDDSLLPDL